MRILKIGGSSLVPHGEEPSDALSTLTPLVGSREPLILLHGTGRTGKAVADLHPYGATGHQHFDPFIYAEVQSHLRALHTNVLVRLIQIGIPAVSMYCSELFHLAHGALKLRPDGLDQLRFYIKQKLVPLAFGDLQVDIDGTMRVISSDWLVASLCAAFPGSQVGFMTNTAGVLDQTGTPLPVLDETTKWTNRVPNHADVTRGMEGKVAHALAAARLSSDVRIFQCAEASIHSWLQGDAVGTQVQWRSNHDH